MKNKSLCWIINSGLFLHVRTCNSISPTDTENHTFTDFYTFTHSIFAPCFYCGSSVTWTSYTQEMPGVGSSCGLLFCFKSCFSFILFVRDGNRHMNPRVRPPIFISLHESTVRKHLRWNSLNASWVQNDPSWRKLHAFTHTLVLMTSVNTLSRYRSFLADLDSPPRAANRADPPVSHKHPKHKR